MNDPPPEKFQLIIPPRPKSFDEALYKSFIESAYVLFQQGYPVSGLKLLLSAVDTMAFLETGKGNSGKEFKAWLEKYVDLQSVGVNSDELWEHRSALLHMTRFHSKAVDKGAVMFLIPSFGSPPQEYKELVKSKMEARYGTNFKVYSLQNLLRAVFEGFDKFLAKVDSNPDLKSVVISNLGEVVPDIPIGATRTR